MAEERKKLTIPDLALKKKAGEKVVVLGLVFVGRVGPIGQKGEL